MLFYNLQNKILVACRFTFLRNQNSFTKKQIQTKSLLVRMKKYHLSFGIISIIWITNEFLSKDEEIVIHASIVILMEGYLPPGHSAGGKKGEKRRMKS